MNRQDNSRATAEWMQAVLASDEDLLARVLELGVQARSSHIVTHNVSDFQGCERFGIEAVTPRQFLEVMG